MNDARPNVGTAWSKLVKKFRAYKKEFHARQREKQARVLTANKAALDAHVAQALRSAQAAHPKSLPIPAIGVVQIADASAAGRQQAPAKDPPLRVSEQPQAQKQQQAQQAQQHLPHSALSLVPSERFAGVRISFGVGKPQQQQQTVKALVRALPVIRPPPSYTTWSYLKRNELARDHGRRMFLVDEHGETVPADDGENEVLLPWERVDGVAVDWAMMRLAEEHGWDNAEVLMALMCVLRLEAQPEAIAQRLAYLLRLRVVEVGREDAELEDDLDVFVGSFCRRCRLYGCRTHSGGHVKPHHRPAPLPPDTSRPPCGSDCCRTAMVVDTPDAQEEDGGGGGGLRGWSTYSVSLLQRGIEVFGRENPCMVAELLRPKYTCAQVKAALDAWERSERRPAGQQAGSGGDDGGGAAQERQLGAATRGCRGGGGSSLAASGIGGGARGGGAEGDAGGLARVPGRRKGGRAKRAVLNNRSTGIVYQARNQREHDQLFHEYQPCTCVGECKADCPCVKALNFCEKFCACSTSCRERFRGCSCKSGCRTNQCPCLAAYRECDPDSCTGCAPTVEGRSEVGRECHNMRLRMRQHARMVLGTSDIPGAGWGLFAAQHVSKNGFLGEYTGDLITQDEANRRGSVYDHMNNSYLFNLNEEWVVDAKFRGNKLRCANHSNDPVAKARVLLVDGESRIGIFADKNLAPGMEITFDYRYTDDTAPQWVKKKPRG